jgi:hypothetical protein
MKELKVGALRLILFLLILANWPLDATEKPDLSHLKTWVGKYPTDEESKPPKNLFHLPEIQNSLKKLLGKTDYKHLTEELSVETPIQIIRNFLVVKVCYPHCCPCDNAMLVINLDDTAFHAGFYERTDKQKFNTRWFSSTGDHLELPKEVLDIFLQTHETK